MPAIESKANLSEYTIYATLTDHRSAYGTERKRHNTDIPIYTHTSKSIRIYHKCEGGIEIFVTSITVWHHEACRVMMTNGVPEGHILISHFHTNDRYFLLTIKFLLF